jgi:hypothetical protein
MEVKVSPEFITSNLLTRVPKAATNSVRGWVLTSSQLAALTAELRHSNYVKYVNSPRIDTAEGIASGLSSGKSTLVDDSRFYTGVEMSVCPWASREGLQLLAHVMMTYSTFAGRTGTNLLSLGTNFDVALRASFPDNGGVFVLDTKNSNAVLISSRKQKKKK